MLSNSAIKSGAAARLALGIGKSAIATDLSRNFWLQKVIKPLHESLLFASRSEFRAANLKRLHKEEAFVEAVGPWIWFNNFKTLIPAYRHRSRVLHEKGNQKNNHIHFLKATAFE